MIIDITKAKNRICSPLLNTYRSSAKNFIDMITDYFQFNNSKVKTLTQRCRDAIERAELTQVKIEQELAAIKPVQTPQSWTTKTISSNAFSVYLNNSFMGWVKRDEENKTWKVYALGTNSFTASSQVNAIAWIKQQHNFKTRLI